MTNATYVKRVIGAQGDQIRIIDKPSSLQFVRAYPL